MTSSFLFRARKMSILVVDSFVPACPSSERIQISHTRNETDINHDGIMPGQNPATLNVYATNRGPHLTTPKPDVGYNRYSLGFCSSDKMCYWFHFCFRRHHHHHQQQYDLNYWSGRNLLIGAAGRKQRTVYVSLTSIGDVCFLFCLAMI